MVKNIAVFLLSVFYILSSCCGTPRRSTSNSRRAGKIVSETTGEYQSKRSDNVTTSVNSESTRNRHIEEVSYPVSSEKVMTGTEIFNRYSSAVFIIYTSTEEITSQGSGFFISSDGLAVTNYHVFQGTLKGYEVIKLSNGCTYKLQQIVTKDEENDVFIFKVDIGTAKVNSVPISNRDLSVGEKVYAIGSPRGLENTFSSGEISQFRDGNIIQISVPIDHGSSGGALINEYGEAIGITSAGLDDSGANLNFAVNISVVRQRLGRQ